MNKKKILLFLLLTLFCVSLNAQKIKIAINDIKVSDQLLQRLSAAEKSSLNYFNNALRVNLESKMSSTKKFTVIARKDLKLLLKEQQLSASGLIDLNSDKIAQFGKISGVEYLLVPEVISFIDNIERRKIEALGRVIEKRETSVSIVSKLYSSTTGELEETVESVFNELDSKERNILSNSVKGLITDNILNDLSASLSEHVSLEITRVVFPPKIIHKKGAQVTINRTEKSGLSLNQIWDVFEVGEDLVDPDTNENLGGSESLIGKIKIMKILPKFSVAEILEDKGIAIGSVLRKAKENE
jgi:hypothetical protein